MVAYFAHSAKEVVKGVLNQVSTHVVVKFSNSGSLVASFQSTGKYGIK